MWNEDGSSIGDAFNFALHEKYLDGSTQRDEVVHYPNAQHPESYITNVVSDLAARFIDRAESPEYNPDEKPRALFVWPNAPNAGAPEPQYANAPLPTWTRRPSYLEKNMSDKPPEIRHSPYRAEADVHRRLRASQLRQLLSLDEMVDRLFKKLQALQVRSETWGIYSSDNGTLWGEHHLSRKVCAYEESIRVPLRMWIPGSDKAIIDQLVANIVVAPTLMALAGDNSAHDFDGRSLLPLLDGNGVGWRKATLVENWSVVRFNATRTTRWKYVLYSKSGHQELYDLHSDPYELDNSYADHPCVVATLRTRMRDLMRQ